MSADALQRNGANGKSVLSSRTLAWGLLGILGVIWGTNFLFMKLAVAVVPPIEVAWFRIIFGAAPIAAYAAVRRLFVPGDWRLMHHFAVMAVLANVGPYVTFVYGAALLPSGVAGVVSGAIPFVTAGVVAFALPAERLTTSKLLGLLVGFSGILLVVPLRGAGPAAGGAPLVGVAAMLVGCISYAFALVYARRFVAPLNLSPVKLAAYQMLFAIILLAPFAAPGHWHELLQDRTAFLALVLGLGLLGTGVAFVIYYQLIQSLGAMKAASVYYIPPVVALAIGWLVAGEAIGIGQVLGAALVIAGIYFANTN